MFSKKATKIEEIFTVDLMVTTYSQIDGEILSIFVALSENVNFIENFNIWLFQNTFLCLFLILTSILRGISTCFCGKAIINQLYKTLQVFFSRFFYLIFTSFVIDCWKRFGEWEKRKLTMKNNGKKVVLIIEILLLFTVFIIIFSYQELFVESFCIPWS